MTQRLVLPTVEWELKDKQLTLYCLECRARIDQVLGFNWGSRKICTNCGAELANGEIIHQILTTHHH